MEQAFSFGSWLGQRRRTLDLTQAELARQLGCATVTLQKIELDERRPSKEMAERLAMVLAIPATEQAAFLQSARGELAVDRLTSPPTSPATATPWRPIPLPHHNLPVPPTPLVGRQREVAAVVERLQRPDVRLLTLTGTGGTGKTRLAIAVAVAVLNEFADGVTFVDLAPIRDPTVVLSGIAQALDIKETGEQPLPERLAAVLRPQQRLLVLDNFEQVLPAAREIATLLSGAPNLKVLVTSRTGLHLSGEHEFMVPPLTLPDLAHLPTLEALSQYEAVALFIQRAQASRPDFHVTNANAAAVAEICARLDGLPLAIELAAARSKILPPEALLARLSGRLQLLTGGARDSPERHRTLRQTIDWSYHLLSSDEQVLFVRLAVFVGGATLEAAEAVCGLGSDLVLDVVDGMQTLIEQSMLRLEGTGQSRDSELRYGMLDTLREYALDRLDASGDGEPTRARHANYFVKLAETAAALLGSPEEAGGLDRLEYEHDNLRSALLWALDHHELEHALRLTVALYEFWEIRGYRTEGRRWLDRTLALPSAAWGTDMYTHLRAKALHGAGLLTAAQGDNDHAAELFDQSLQLFRTLQNLRGMAMALNSVGEIALDREALDPSLPATASHLFAEALTLAQTSGDLARTGLLLHNLGVAAEERGNTTDAMLYYERALTLRREIGDVRGIGRSLKVLGGLAERRGDATLAGELYAEALVIAEHIGDRGNQAWLLNDIGVLDLAGGNGALAAARLVESTRLLHDLGYEQGVVVVLTCLAEVAYQQQHPELAARLLGAAAGIQQRHKLPMFPSDSLNYARVISLVEATAGPTQVAQWMEAGRDLELDKALDEVQGQAVTVKQ